MTIVFVDTETTSLRPDRRAWDIALILRRPGKPDVEHQWFIAAEDLDLGGADPFALKIGHFYERQPQFRVDREFTFGDVADEDDVLAHVELLTRDAHLVGAVPGFDAEVLGTRMRVHGIPPGWHYHLIDVETLAVGYVRALTGLALELPWASEHLSRMLDVPVPAAEDRHTALGDARWARDMYDAVMGGVWPAAAGAQVVEAGRQLDAIRSAAASSGVTLAAQ